ncbi:membrane bound O-acyl transferase MBOAT family protein [Fluviicola taffensis DSM 16823]|uniref:Membrane bound O-acyl transferase MBOAT family protein n=1 Tax=Fluviicola taffensis (strain DSM 16823 / NCIMB 13979 / RW262) TaxID=755732 RepID=F2ICR4_FLUTR|nr:membrane bound O-acyl transferase MBOAT family protein [Fluviicola taffensis DSM 16823]
MVFSSTLFLFYFLPFFLLVYHVVPKSLKNWVIFFFSILFYTWGAPVFIFILLGTSFLDFLLVRIIHRTHQVRKKKVLLIISVTINLGLLAYFKYSNFFIENANALLNGFGFKEVSWATVIMPIGISFFTFESITYTVDVYRGKHAPLRSLKDYFVYLLAFPKLIAGPIVRFQEIADEVTERTENIDEKLIGFFRFCIGLAKKVLIANMMAKQVQAVFWSDFNQLDATTAWIGMFAYTMQIYFDFSGYSDMAIGLGKMIGFHFPENFNSPYSSKSITEFWRRWHMTLGNFMRDYLYIPLGGNRVSSKARLYFNLGLVFILSGFWHGASWNFIIWGAYHGLFLILDRIFLAKLLGRLGAFVAIPFTFLVVMVGWIIFCIEDLNGMGIYLQKLIDFDSVCLVNVFPSFWPIAILAIFFSFIYAFPIGKKMQDFVFARNTYSLTGYFGFLFLSLVLFALSVSSIVSSGFNPFIYFRF